MARCGTMTQTRSRLLMTKMPNPMTVLTTILVVSLITVPSLVENVTAIDYACNKVKGSNNTYEFCDQSLDIDRRVKNLVSSLTLDEKLGLMTNTALGVTRLGIPSYQWQNEGLHGVAHSPGVSFSGLISSATSFPQPILTAASFNATLFNKIGKVISTEARAFYNFGESGLTYWTPNINIFRDPRWGRGQETPGEDPLLTSVYAEYFVRGLQELGDYDGNTSSPVSSKLKLSACCKHLTAYDLEAWDGVMRYGFNAVVTQQDLEDTFNPPFKSCVQKGRASGLMCSYNAINGIPSCADKELLTTLARDEWGFDGYWVSDCDAVSTIYDDQKYADPEHAVAAALKAGMDLNCGVTFSKFSEGALSKGLITEGELDVALTRSFKVQFRLGLFDGNPLIEENYDALAEASVCSEEHQELAIEAAMQGMVLLKNDNDLLPFSRDTIKNLAVIGPNANDTMSTMIGNYAGNPCNYVTPLQGLKDYFAGSGTTIQYVAGCNETTCEPADIVAGIAAATYAAGAADATIVIVGLGQVQETEAMDRLSLLLPGQQQELVMEVANAAKGPVLVVVMSGGPVDMKFARNAKKIGAILWAGYPGQGGGEALAQIIFGDRNPGGKLPMTWYPETFTAIPMTTMNMRPDDASSYPGRTYRFYTGETVYNFGDGLSYSNFVRSFSNNTNSRSRESPTVVAPNAAHMLCYDDASGCADADVQFCRALEFTVDVVVSNNHGRAGSDVVMLYASPPNAGEGGLPLKQLIAFQRVNLAGHETTTVQFPLKPCMDFATTRSDGSRELLEGVHIISANGDVEFPVEYTMD